MTAIILLLLCVVAIIVVAIKLFLLSLDEVKSIKNQDKRDKEYYDNLFSPSIPFKLQVDLKMLAEEVKKKDYTLLWIKIPRGAYEFTLIAYLCPGDVTLKEVRSGKIDYDMIACHTESDFLRIIKEQLLADRNLK